MKSERTSVQAEAAAWAKLRRRRWPGTFNMAGEEGSEVKSSRLLNLFSIPEVSEHGNDED